MSRAQMELKIILVTGNQTHRGLYVAYIIPALEDEKQLPPKYLTHRFDRETCEL
jgi:hypothetical protein